MKREALQYANDMNLISQIADRARSTHPHLQKMSLVMDIDFVNQVNPLRLKDLLEADEFNFWHDVYGIMQNFNRESKRLENCCLPRFTA